MGLIRGSLLVIISIFLFISLLIGNVLLIMSWSLQYENVQEELKPILKNITKDQLNFIEEDFNLTEELERALEFMGERCQNETSYVFAGGGYTFVIPCDVLDEAKEDPDVILDIAIENIIEQVYYDDYDCGFWECLVEGELPLFLVSEKAQNYWEEKFYIFLLASVILVVLGFFLLESKQSFPIYLGAILTISALPLIKIKSLVSGIADDSYLAFINIFFSKTSSVFWLVFVLGLIILIAGILVRFFFSDFFKKKFSKRDIQKIVRKEQGNKSK